MSKLEIPEVKPQLGKLTMKESYSKTKVFPVRIRGYIDLLRPFTLLAPIIVSMSIMVASLVYNNQTAPPDWWATIAYAGLTLAFANGASNALNQATDVEADKISKPYRPIPRGIVSSEEAQSIAYILYLFALLRSITINIWFGLFVFLIMLFTVTYSLPPRMKQFIFINQIWIAIPRGLLGILAAWSVFGDPFQKEPLIIGTIATLFLVGGMATKDVVDKKADKLTGTSTLINTYGSKKTAMICFPFMFFPFLSVPLLINGGLLDMYFWPLTLLMIPSFFVFYLLMRESESKTLENVHAWSIMYVEYIFFALGFPLMIIIARLFF
ncbi:MAG: UbiA prenyltransferase family protein [Candidatus Thermoplasmatota archaeon]|nr:UbiA prenyltransferase family protein [Candidatus Thermoplasmatota archaeon]